MRPDDNKAARDIPPGTDTTPRNRPPANAEAPPGAGPDACATGNRSAAADAPDLRSRARATAADALGPDYWNFLAAYGGRGGEDSAPTPGTRALGALLTAAATPVGEGSPTADATSASTPPPSGQAAALAAYRAAREAGVHEGGRTRRRDDWRPGAVRRRRLAVRAMIGALLAGVTVGGVAVAGMGRTVEHGPSVRVERPGPLPTPASGPGPGPGSAPGHGARPGPRPGSSSAVPAPAPRSGGDESGSAAPEPGPPSSAEPVADVRCPVGGVAAELACRSGGVRPPATVGGGVGPAQGLIE